ncbi:MAG: Gfo/Idh/MocA family oxidoreductase [Bryobacteraceae bacterium]
MIPSASAPERRLRVAVVGAGQFGRNHCRTVAQSSRAELVAVVDTDAQRAVEAASAWGSRPYTSLDAVLGSVDAAIVAVPTAVHADVGAALLEAGAHVLVEKPIAPDLESAARLTAAARRNGRILQVGHLERFNPAVTALEARCRLPLFFEVHRMSVFSPRSLDIDVVLDLMIHDIDIVLSLVGAAPAAIHAAGISILSPKEDIANVRMEFPNGCIANLTASRVSTDKVRKLRLFQPRQYLSLDYTRQSLAAFTVSEDRRITFEQAAVRQGEPLVLQLDSFLDCVETGAAPNVGGEAASAALGVALAILDKIKEHAAVVSKSLAAGWKP